MLGGLFQLITYDPSNISYLTRREYSRTSTNSGYNYKKYKSKSQRERKSRNKRNSQHKRKSKNKKTEVKIVEYIKGLQKFSSTECSICFTDFNHKDKVSLLSCNHYFCTHCITNWRKNKNTCPLCRKPF